MCADPADCLHPKADAQPVALCECASFILDIVVDQSSYLIFGLGEEPLRFKKEDRGTRGVGRNSNASPAVGIRRPRADLTPELCRSGLPICPLT